MNLQMLETRVIVATDMARRWKLGHALSPLRKDMDYIAGVMLELAKKTESLDRELTRLRRGRTDKRAFCRPTKQATNPRTIAAQIAESAGDGPVTVYRVKGALRWCNADRPVPEGYEVIGTYDTGADVRCIAEDLQA